MKNKKVKFEGKLILNKATIARLNESQMNKVGGGRGNFTLLCLLTRLACQTIYECQPPPILS